MTTLTPYDPYKKHSDSSLKGALRPIGINRNNVLGCVQIRPYMPDEIKSVEWIALGSNVFNAMIPFYSNIDKVPDYLGNTTGRVTTEDFYWTNRIIAALADPHYTYTSNFIEQYQNKVQSSARNILNNYDKEFLEQKYTAKKASALCEQANEKMARMLKLETENLLDKVLFEASFHMKNSFSRSDA